jgi:hypothetical protein
MEFLVKGRIGFFDPQVFIENQQGSLDGINDLQRIFVTL